MQKSDHKKLQLLADFSSGKLELFADFSSGKLELFAVVYLSLTHFSALPGKNGT